MPASIGQLVSNRLSYVPDGSLTPSADAAMLYLHRSFFAQAMLDHPTNPLLSPFAPSFLTAYRCAAVIIRASAHQFDRCAEMAMRVWILMYHMFSAAVRSAYFHHYLSHTLTLQPDNCWHRRDSVAEFERGSQRAAGPESGCQAFRKDRFTITSCESCSGMCSLP